MSFLKIWGCDAYVKKLQPNKLESQSDKCVFVGYPKETIGYSFYNKTEGKVFVAKTSVFLEKEFLAKGLSGRMRLLEQSKMSKVAQRRKLFRRWLLRLRLRRHKVLRYRQSSHLLNHVDDD